MSKRSYEKDDDFNAEAYSINGYRGVAWYALGWETEPGSSEWWDDEIGEYRYDEEPCAVRTGRVVCVMVGDDFHFVFDPEELTPLARESYCGSCGQIGCTHDGLDRSG